MSSTFTVARLVNSEALVTGTDVFGETGKVVVNTCQWDELKAHSAMHEAGDAFDAAVNEFFAPLLEAAEKIGQSVEVPTDPSSFVVLHEEVEHVEGRSADIVRLTSDSVILRLIEQGDTDRLVWVEAGGSKTLQVLAVDSAPATGNTPLPVVPTGDSPLG